MKVNWRQRRRLKRTAAMPFQSRAFVWLGASPRLPGICRSARPTSPALSFPSCSQTQSCWGREEDAGDGGAPVEVQVDSGQLPLVEGPDGEQVFRFYWLDAFEEPYSRPGTPPAARTPGLEASPPPFL